MKVLHALMKTIVRMTLFARAGNVLALNLALLRQCYMDMFSRGKAVPEDLKRRSETYVRILKYILAHSCNRTG
jgi:hypothetical protein